MTVPRLRPLGFKADAETEAALERVVARLAGPGASSRSRSAVIRRLIFAADQGAILTDDQRKEIAHHLRGKTMRSETWSALGVAIPKKRGVR